MKPSWLDWMESHNGVHEIPGDEDHPLIIEALATCDNLGEWAKNRDETAWCAAIITLAMERNGFTGTRHGLASRYLDWGMEMVGPQLGAVTIIRRKGGASDAATGSRRGFHVSLFKEAVDDGLWLHGGNQRDQIKVSFYPRRRYDILGYRWPVLRSS
jgi:uncharacterized protein (TIGR02594 family)